MNYMALDKSNPLPLYHQLKNYLEKRIQEDYKPGDVFPSENEISKLYDVSRITVRAAIQELERAGLVEKKQGKGTFIKSNVIERNTKKLLSWTQEMELLGYKPKLVHIFEEVYEADRTIAALFEIKEGTEIKKITRIKYIEEGKIFIISSILNPQYIPKFNIQELGNNSLYEMFKTKYNYPVRFAEEIVEAKAADKSTAETLHIEPGEPILSIKRTSYLQNQKILATGQLISRAGAYQYKARLFAKPLLS